MAHLTRMAEKIYIDSPVNIVIILEGDVNIVGLV